MNLTRWNPWAEIDTLQTELQRLMDGRALETARPTAARGWTPSVDIFEETERYLLKFDLPETSMADVDVHVEGQTLTVKGERKLENEEHKQGYHRIERTYGQFSRTFALPNNVETDKIQASCHQGVLRIDLPKKAEAQPRKVPIAQSN